MATPGQLSPLSGAAMTPLIALPPEAISPARGGQIEMVVKMHTTRVNEATEDASDLDYWPSGIDYEKWAPLARPAPARTFADPLDFLDIPEE